jgi:hypothetical protein
MQGAQLWFSVHGIVAANRGDTFSSSDSWSSKIETTNKQQLFSVSKIYNLIKQQEMFKKKKQMVSLCLCINSNQLFYFNTKVRAK